MPTETTQVSRGITIDKEGRVVVRDQRLVEFLRDLLAGIDFGGIGNGDEVKKGFNLICPENMNIGCGKK